MKNGLLTLCICLALFLLAHYDRSITEEIYKKNRKHDEATNQLSSIKSFLSENSFEKAFETVKDKTAYLKTPKNFNISFSKNSCMKKNPDRWTMYIFVKSTVFNLRNRQFIRRTWASLSYVDGGRFVTIFVIGRSQRNQDQLKLDKEIEQYNDILQIDASDEYSSIAQKTLVGMQWATENLPGDYFYSSADDDFLVNMGRVQEIIDQSQNNMKKRMWPEFPIVCLYESRLGTKPIRKQTSKYFISIESYEWPLWPDFCLGGMYATSMRVTRKLWEASRVEKPVEMDDAWITGVLRQKIGMPRQYIKTIVPPVAVHYFGFADNNNSVSAEEYVKEDWKKIYDTFKTKELCTHS